MLIFTSAIVFLLNNLRVLAEPTATALSRVKLRLSSDGILLIAVATSHNHFDREFRAKGARTRQPRAERSAALGLGVPHTRPRAESAQRGRVSRFQRSKSFRGDR